MKNGYEILKQKEEELARVRREIDSLRIVAGLLEDDARLAEGNAEFKEKQFAPEEKNLDVRLDHVHLDLDTLSNGGLFSVIGRFAKFLRAG